MTDLQPGVEKVPYHLTQKGRATRRAWYEKNKKRHMDRKLAVRREYARKNPLAVHARYLLGQAVKMGYIPRPPGERTRTWGNRWEFHHPDHSRPYFGCWLKAPEHRLVHLGKMPCPECTDYEGSVKYQVLRSWGLA